MNNSSIAKWRMYSHRLWGPPLTAPDEVVRWLGAVQAQEFAYAKWSIAQRTSGINESAVDQAFAEGKFLRTHILRPTWHFVSASDLRWLLAISGPRVNALNMYRYKQLDLDEKTLAKTNAVISKALKGGRHLTRKELAERIAGVRIETQGQRLAYIVMRAELEGLICSGVMKGKQHTYALLDERVPSAGRIDREVALAKLINRYFTSRGPATLKDFVRWSGFATADARNGLEIASSKLAHEVIDGRTYWFGLTSPKGKAPINQVDLVQGYDECIMGYSDSRDALFAPSSEVTYRPGTNLMHAILLNGQLIGHWKHVIKGKSLALERAFHRSLDQAESKALKLAEGRYATFKEKPLQSS